MASTSIVGPTAISTADVKGEIDSEPRGKKYNRSKRFWAIIVTCSVIGILSALENTVVTTALPFIVTQLDLGENYIWVTNVFFLTGAAVQPLFAQLANIFGRRWVTLTIVMLFTVGSAIAGGATDGAMLIAGRAIQGMGGGGINIIVDVIVSDLVPLRERGNYMAVILLVYTVGTTLGPWVGGLIVMNTTWRWVFYLNLPFGGVAMVMVILFLHVEYNKEMTFAQRLGRIDYLGNLVLMGSTVAVLYALTYGGTTLPWSAPSVLTPLLIGLAGMGLFMWIETTSLAPDPVVPPRLFTNRTSATILAATFLNSAMLYWVVFFLPVYFQAVLGASPARAGVQMLPAILVAIPGAVLAVLLLARFGRYKPLHVAGFAVTALGLGLLSMLDERTSTAQFVVYQAVGGLGSGMVLNTLLPAVQAQFEERDQAATTGAWSFVRAFGSIFGVAIPAAVFNNRFAELLGERVGPGEVAAVFEGGNKAYQHASADFVAAFPSPVREVVRGVYSDSLKLVWQISIAFAGVSFLLVLLEREVMLRTDLDTEFGMEKRKPSKHGGAATANV